MTKSEELLEAKRRRMKERTQPKARDHQRLKALLDTGGSFFVLLWKTLPAWTFLAGLLLWSYLDQIGRPDLIISSIANAQGLVAFIGTFVLTCLATLLLLVLPSIYFGVIHASVGVDISTDAQRGLPRHLLWLAVGVCVGILLFAATRWKSHGVILLGILLGVIAPFLFDYAKTRDLDRLRTFFGPEPAWRVGHAIAYVIAMFLGGFIAIWPSLIVLPFVNLDADAWHASLSFVGIVTTAAVVSLLPAMALIREHSSGGSLRRQLFAFSIALCLVAYMFFVHLRLPVTDRLIESTVTKLGIRVMDAYPYRVHSKALRAAEFDQDRWQTKESGDGFFVNAIVPFSFGDVRLLCPSRLGNGDKLKKWSSLDCVEMRRDEVRRVPDKGPFNWDRE